MSSEHKELSLQLELDWVHRWSQFQTYLDTLSRLRNDGDTATAARYARRAVTPLIDYTSLRALHEFYPREAQPNTALRIAVLGGPTTAQLVEALETFLWSDEIPAMFYQCDYGLFRQEILSDSSGLDEFAPNLIIIAVDHRDVLCVKEGRRPDELSEERIRAEAESWLHLWQIANKRWGCDIIQNTYLSPDYPIFGNLAMRLKGSRESQLAMLNQRMTEIAPGYVMFHDVSLLVRECGANNWFDPRFYAEAKLPCAPECLVSYGHSLASIVRALRGRSKKVLVLDLDNTLWGGVVGDLGSEGIDIGQGTSQGEAFLAIQQYAKDLSERGILLAVCSKNDDDRAREPFQKRRDMILKLEDFACFTANWEHKARNLTQIAENLRLGLDSFVFVDDNPAERALVRRALPQVGVPDLSDDAAYFVREIAKYRYFETVSYTREDANRARCYTENAKRESLKATSGDLSDFLSSLEMIARTEQVHPLNIQRVAQLVNKSNQFNLTTKRYTEAEINSLTSDPRWITLAVSLKDRLGDSGLISVVFCRNMESRLVIDTWLMSCRVLQRGVEDYVLSKIVGVARQLNVPMIEGHYIPTEKNKMVKDLYKRHGFDEFGAIGATAVWQIPTHAWSPSLSYIKEEVERG